MISLNIDNTLISIGSFDIKYYGLVYAVGFLAALYALLWAAKKEIISIPQEKAYDLVFYLMIGLLIGARIFYVL